MNRLFSVADCLPMASPRTDRPVDERAARPDDDRDDDRLMAAFARGDARAFIRTRVDAEASSNPEFTRIHDGVRQTSNTSVGLLGTGGRGARNGGGRDARHEKR